MLLLGLLFIAIHFSCISFFILINYFFFFCRHCCITVTHKSFHLFYSIAGIVIVCYFVRSLMAFICQVIKGLLTYLLALVTLTLAR